MLYPSSARTILIVFIVVFSHLPPINTAVFIGINYHSNTFTAITGDRLLRWGFVFLLTLQGVQEDRRRGRREGEREREGKRGVEGGEVGEGALHSISEDEQ